MANNVQYVTAGQPKTGGAAWRAPLGTKLPTTATEALDPAFACLGFISEEGVTNSNSPASESVKAWGGEEVLHYQTGKPDTFKYTMLEALNVNVLKAVYGDDNVEGTLETGIHVKANNKRQKECAWVFDMVFKGDVAKRLVIPCAPVTAVEDIVYKATGAVGYGTTISAQPDENGDTHHEYISGTVAAAAAAAGDESEPAAAGEEGNA